jgi:hypothetical protein
MSLFNVSHCLSSPFNKNLHIKWAHSNYSSILIHQKVWPTTVQPNALSVNEDNDSISSLIWFVSIELKEKIRKEGEKGRGKERQNEVCVGGGEKERERDKERMWHHSECQNSVCVCVCVCVCVWIYKHVSAHETILLGNCFLMFHEVFYFLIVTWQWFVE